MRAPGGTRQTLSMASRRSVLIGAGAFAALGATGAIEMGARIDPAVSRPGDDFGTAESSPYGRIATRKRKTPWAS